MPSAIWKHSLKKEKLLRISEQDEYADRKNRIIFHLQGIHNGYLTYKV
jgi:hypothetical protein